MEHEGYSSEMPSYGVVAVTVETRCWGLSDCGGARYGYSLALACPGRPRRVAVPEKEYRSDITPPPSTTSMDDGVLLCCRLSIYTHIYDRNEHFGGNDNENESTIGNKRSRRPIIIIIITK